MVSVKLTRPMLAAAVDDVSKLRYPLIASPKLDGIRCLVIKGKALSRSLKPIPNEHVRKLIEASPLTGFDGELMVPGSFQNVSSEIMSRDGKPKFIFNVFDDFSIGLLVPYKDRLRNVRTRLRSADISQKWVRAVPTQKVANEHELLKFEDAALRSGFEGICLRDPDGQYKRGRSTFKQHWLLKLKRFEDGEALINGFEEQRSNLNEATLNELGYTQRSSAKAGKKLRGTLGALLVRDLKTGVCFRISTGVGLTNALRQEIWDSRNEYLNRIVKYRFQPHGTKDKPRLPVLLGFRDARDM